VRPSCLPAAASLCERLQSDPRHVADQLAYGTDTHVGCCAEAREQGASFPEVSESQLARRCLVSRHVAALGCSVHTVARVPAHPLLEGPRPDSMASLARDAQSPLLGASVASDDGDGGSVSTTSSVGADDIPVVICNPLGDPVRRLKRAARWMAVNSCVTLNVGVARACCAGRLAQRGVLSLVCWFSPLTSIRLSRVVAHALVVALRALGST